MIQVSFSEARDRNVLSLRLQGHAGQAPHGFDLVCAAASILTYTAAQVACDMFSDGKLASQPCLRLKKGDALVVVRPKAEFYDEALYALYIAQVGFFLLSRNYPQYVRLSAFGKDAS